jgi:ABC-type Zn2+ transport system substrate-binding protein/surface adhesin
MADASIRIRLGQLEIDYEGDAAFLKADLIKTVKELIELQKDATAEDAEGESGGAKPERGKKFDHSTSTMATVLRAKSGSDLIVAAAAHLHFANSKSKYTRTDLHRAMREAHAHYKKTYANNLSKYLTNLTKSDELRLVGSDTYALSAKKVAEIEAKLAEAK